MNTKLSPIGLAAGLVASAIWGGALAVTRLGISGDAGLESTDIAMLRFTGPALLLSPVLVRAWSRLRKVSPWLLCTLILGGGAPFVLVTGGGLSIAGAAEAGALLPGTVPLCVALASRTMGERMGAFRIAGLVIIGAAVAAVVAPALVGGSASQWPGYLLLLFAALLSSAYTMALRWSGIGAWEAAALVSAASVVGLGPVYLLALEPGLGGVPLPGVALQAVFQGLASGILAPVAFAVAVQRLGAANASAFGCLSPGIACLAGVVLLGEAPDGMILGAVIASCVGVALVSLASGTMNGGLRLPSGADDDAIAACAVPPCRAVDSNVEQAARPGRQ